MIPDDSPKTRVVHIRDNVPGAVYIGRAMPRQGLKASPFANPFRIGSDMTRNQAIRGYEYWFSKQPNLYRKLPELRGKPLACWCRHDGEPRTDANACHGDFLVELLTRYSDEELFRLVEGQDQ